LQAFLQSCSATAGTKDLKINNSGLSIVIPTYQREKVLIDTVAYVLRLDPGPSEVLIIDQTKEHTPETLAELIRWEKTGKLRWIRLASPSIPHSMNTGLKEAKHDIVLFLDDDILPDKNLVAAHIHAHSANSCDIIAGQVLQPGEKSLSDNGSGVFRFCSDRQQLINDFIGCNFSVHRKSALALGGFDENFVQVAYSFEKEFSDRALAAGGKILFEPAASIRHLKVTSGGTRSFGEHLKTVKPGHTVGAYYYLLRSKRMKFRFLKIMGRALRSVRTRHHLLHPWWIPLTLVSEFLGLVWAVFLFLRGPRYVSFHETVLKR